MPDQPSTTSPNKVKLQIATVGTTDGVYHAVVAGDKIVRTFTVANGKAEARKLIDKLVASPKNANGKLVADYAIQSRESKKAETPEDIDSLIDSL